MKKIISAGMAAAMIVPSAVVFADEAAQTAPVMLYNNQVVASDEFVPFITDGRLLVTDNSGRAAFLSRSKISAFFNRSTILTVPV